MVSPEHIKRFDFDALHDFSQGAPQIADEEPSNDNDHTAAMEEVPPPPPTFSESELHTAKIAAKQEGYTEGFSAGKQEADKEAAALNSALENVSQKIVTGIERIQGEYQHYLSSQSPELTQLVMMIAQRIAGSALELNPTANLESMLKECLALLVPQPKVHVHLHPDLHSVATALIQPLLNRAGFEGELHVHADNTIAKEDVSIEWPNGGAERNTQALWQQIERVVQQMDLGQPIPDVPASYNKSNMTASGEPAITTDATSMQQMHANDEAFEALKQELAQETNDTIVNQNNSEE